MNQMTFFVRKLVLIVSFIDDAFGLLFTSWQQAVFDDLHERCKADHALDFGSNTLRQIQEIHMTVGLDVDTHGILAVQVGDTDLIFAGDLRESLQDLFDLTREYVDALDLHHIERSCVR